MVDVHMRSWKATYRGILPREFLTQLERGSRIRYWSTRVGAAASDEELVAVAERGAVIIGFVYVCPTTDEDDDAARVGLIEFFHVDPAWWGRGVGRRLMAEAIAWMRRAGFDSGSLWVVADNARAQAFYQALGWRPDGSARIDRLAVGDEHGIELPALRYRIGLGSDNNSMPEAPS
jgi:GNAT superfamily N-acetyltransferase